MRMPPSKWVFAYGSLMWRPGFPHDEMVPAKVTGYHRALCVYSHVHRGTPDRPGLVLGLDEGGECFGLAYRVGQDNWSAVLNYLREREQANYAYKEVELEMLLEGGRTAHGLAFVADRSHRQYAGGLNQDSMLRLIRQGHGVSGANTDYIFNTCRHLLDAGIHDAGLTELLGLLQQDQAFDCDALSDEKK